METKRSEPLYTPERKYNNHQANLYMEGKYGELGILEQKNLYHTYKIHHADHLLKAECGREIITVEICLEERVLQVHLSP
jgi:Fe2+ or Zn2+ uptake regulation protein